LPRADIFRFSFPTFLDVALYSATADIFLTCDQQEFTYWLALSNKVTIVVSEISINELISIMRKKIIIIIIIIIIVIEYL